MYVIVTDMGQLVPIDPDSVHTMPELQEHLASMTRTPLEDQILLLPTGVQLKAQHLNDEDTCILFNRQLLETKDSHLVIADHALPTLTALPAALSPTLPQDETLWPARCLETYELLHPIVADDKQVAAEVMDDLNALHVAWKAAIANLDHHIKTTYDVQDQFDRMAQRELSKADHTLQSMERDWMLFMQRWPVHPAMASQKHPSPQSKTSSVASLSPTPSPTSHQIIESAPLPLTTALDLQPLQQQRAQLAQQLQKLDNKRKKLLGRLDHIRQQATQLHMREANANAKTAATTNTTLQQIDRHGALFQSIHARLTHPKTRARSPSHADTVDLSQSELIAALEDQWRAETSKNDSDAAASPATATLTYAQCFQGLLLCQSVVRQSVDAMIDVKRSTMRQLFRSLRVISTLQEAIANLFATLRHVSQEVKKLGQKLDDLHAVTIDILQGYGMALIELWRRSQYDSCIMNNAKRLADWYTQTAAAEQSYRRRFLASVAIIDQLDTVFAPNAKFGVCIIPFACKDLHKLTPSTKMHLSVTSDRKSVEHAIEKEDIHDYIEALKEHYQQENRELVDQLFDAWTQASQYIQQSFLTPGPHALDKALAHSPPVSSSPPLSNSPTTMQVQPYPVSLKEHEWPSMTSALAQVQELQAKMDALERQHADEKQLFQQQRQTLLQEIDKKDQLIADQQDQAQAHWLAKIQALEAQLEQEKEAHEQDVLEWKDRYDQAMELEQQKTARRLQEFHGRLASRSCDQCGERLSLHTRSAPSSPVRANMPVEDDPMAISEGQLLAPASSSAMSSAAIAARRRYSSVQSIQDVQNAFKVDLLTREIQDAALRHQAHIDNLVSEHEQNIQDLMAQHEQTLQLHQIQHESHVHDLQQHHKAQLDQAKTKVDQKNPKHDDKAANKLKQRVAWLKCELDMMQKEHDDAIYLAKKINEHLDPTLQADDMQQTLLTLLQRANRTIPRIEAISYVSAQEHDMAGGWMFPMSL